jgi:hypothetical protein
MFLREVRGRSEDGVRTVDGKEGEWPVKGRELFLPVIDQHSKAKQFDFFCFY